VFAILEGAATKLFSYFLNKKYILRQLDYIIVNKYYTILKSNN